MNGHRASVGWPGMALALAALAGCAAGAFDSDRPFQQVYVIDSPELPAMQGVLPADLTVARPVARPGLDSDRIAVLYPDRRLDYYAASRWGGTTDLVVQNLLVGSLRGAARLRLVQSDASLFSTEFVLQTEITGFQAEYAAGGGPPQVHVELVVTVGRGSDRRPLASFTASGRAAAADNTLSAVVSAFESAYAEAARVVVERTVATLTEAKSSAAQNVDSPVPSISR